MLQPPGGLFTQSGDPAPEYWVDDLANLRNFVEGFYSDHGIECQVSYLQLARVQESAEKILSTNVGIRTPSVFKRAAAFTLGFMYAAPVLPVLGPDAFSKELQKVGHIENHQSAVIAFGYSRRCLHGAVYHRGDEEVTLANRIKVSHHLYADIIFSLTTLPKAPYPLPSPPSFHVTALLYESLAYHQNDGGHDPWEV